MRPVRRLLRISAEPRLALACALVAPLWFIPGVAGLVLGGAGLAAVVVATIVDWMRLPGREYLAVEREVPESLGLGDETPIRYVVQSRWRRDVTVRIADELPDALQGGATASGTAVAVPAGAEVVVTLPVTGVRRGRFPLGRVGWRAHTPLGLLAAYWIGESEHSVLVAPSVSGVRRFRLLAIQHRLHTAGVRALRRKGEGQSFAGLREYAVGDDPRHVDWKATARRNTLITREYSIEQSQTVLTLVDAGRGMTQLAGAYPRFEHALSSALVLTDVAVAAGDRVGTLLFDDEVRAFVPPRRGRGALGAIRNALIPVTATMTEPDYAAAFRYLAVHQRRRALIVFFTDVIDVRASRALVAHVTRSAARHLVVIVALRNDALIASALPSGRKALDLYESAAAEELISSRDEALERMRRAGATVLDVSPTGMTAAVVNRYLEIKGRGAL
ncbi:MAG: DUF58 domain-containing protein [Gemmatimonadaceae bacterium]|nr:DUF58 domain-containing protein [Gemmatimonadaceae bacterium]